MRGLRTFLITIGTIGLLLAVFVPMLTGSSANQGPALARFFTVPSSTVTRIILRPSSPPYTSPIASPIIVTNPQTIDRILQALRPANKVQPNHPATLTQYEIEIVTASGSSYGTIHSTSNQGVLLYVHSRPGDGWNYGAFQNDGLSALHQIASGGGE